MEYFFIESDRLKLIPLTYDHLLLHEHPEKLAAALGLTSATIQMEEPFKSGYVDALENFWKPNIIKYPHYYKWYTNWLIVLKSINSAIGGIGLAGILNENGETETGYAMDLHHRNKGYATEALSKLADWVFEHEGAKSLIAHTYRETNASQRTLIKSGFTCIGPEITDDGEVFLWRKGNSRSDVTVFN